MKNMRLSLLLLLLFPCLLMGDKVRLKNYAPSKLWVYIEKRGILGIDASVKDYVKVINPGASINEDGDNMPSIWVLPYNDKVKKESNEARKDESEKTDLTTQIKNMARFLSFIWTTPYHEKAKKESNEARKDESEKLGLKTHIGHMTRIFSFDIDPQGKPHLYEGDFPLSQQKVSIIALSDVHTKDDAASKNTEAIKLRQQIENYIKDPSKCVEAVIFVGDSAGGYGKESETNAFKKIWYNPLKELLYQKGGQIFLVPGNHDTYWESITEPTSKMKVMIKERYGGYQYKFNLGYLHCFNLGLYPASGENQKDRRNVTLLKTSPASLSWLKTELAKLDKTDPIILIFHYPIHGSFSEWWHKSEKDALFNAIKDYNVLAILVGHNHTTQLYSFRGKCPVAQAADVSCFAYLTFDQANPKAISIKFIDKQGNEVRRPIRNDIAEKDFEKE